MSTTETQQPLVIQESDLTEQDLADLLAQQSETNDGAAQIVDAEGNVVMVSMEQLASAGIDVENIGELTEDQLAHLMNLVNQQQSSTDTKSPSEIQQQRQENSQPQTTADETVESADSLTMVIGEDGSLKLSDGSGQIFVLAPDQLADSNINVNNLTDDQIQQIVQMAMPHFEVGKQNRQSNIAGGNSKRVKFNDDFATSSDHTASISFDQQLGDSLNRRVGQKWPLSKLSASGLYSLIGQEVEVKKGGKSLPATIRYCRHGDGYKVQFDDGHFEWVAEEQIELRGLTSKRGDHESYSGASAIDSEACNGIGSGGVGRRLPPAIPGIKVSSLSQSNDKDADPNFCCPICDRKVYQKEPAYIVIRLPACETCADSKILVVDQQSQEEAGNESDNNSTNQQAAESPSSSRKETIEESPKLIAEGGGAESSEQISSNT